MVRLSLTVRLVLALTLCLLLSAGFVSAQDPITLTIAGTGSPGAEFQWLNETVKPAFEAMMAEQGTPVTVEVIDNGNVSGEDQKQQYILDLSVGEGGDVMAFDGFWLPEFVDAGLLTPLSELVGENYTEWEGWAQIPSSIQRILAYDGNTYGIPRGTDARVIWVNTEILEEAGLGADWQPTSWAELLDGARTIKAALPEVTPIQLNAGTAMGEATTLQGYLLALLGTGHHIYDFEQGKWIVSSQGILDTLNLYKTIYIDEGLGDPRWQLVQDGRNLGFEAFANGQVAMSFEGDFMWRSVLVAGGSFPMENRNDRVSFIRIPAQEPGSGINGQDFVTASGGTGFVLNPNTDHPQEAWQLLTFMFSTDMLNALQEIQPRIRARLDVPVTNDEVMTRIVTEVLPLTVIRPQLPAYNAVSAQAQLMTERVVSGEMTPEQAMEAYAAAVTEIVGADNVIELPLGE